MSQYRRILLFASPLLRRTAAFERAAWLAKVTGASLHISLTSRDGAIERLLRSDPAAGEAARQRALQRPRAWLDEEGATLRGEGLRVSWQVSFAPRAREEMLAQIAEYGADLVVKDAHHEPLLRRLIMSGGDWNLLRSCPAPLLLVGSLTHAIPRRIVVAVDVGSGCNAGLNERILQQSLALALQCDAELHLAYVFQMMPALEGTDLMGAFFDAILRIERDAFDTLARAHGVPRERAHFLMGPPAETLAGFALRREADVVVIGSAQHRLHERLLLGTTAEAVVERAPCDVLAISLGQS